jgi:hypothetical protein
MRGRIGLRAGSPQPANRRYDADDRKYRRQNQHQQHNSN